MHRRKFNQILINFPLFFHPWLSFGANKNTFGQEHISLDEFRIFVRQNMVLPQPINEENRFIVVPLKFIITKNGSILNAEFDESVTKPRETYFTNIEFKVTRKSRFLNEAIRLVNLYPKWKNFNQNLDDSNYHFKVNVFFNYHQLVFSAKEEKIVLNPSQKPYFQSKEGNPHYLFEGKYGCDGIIHLLCIVEKNGELSNFEGLGSSGKTNLNIAINDLSKLGALIPAKHNNEIVRSQLDLLVYT